MRQLLADPARQWVGTVEAQRLLGVQSVNTVKAWAQLGLLRSRRLPNGRLQLHLDDLLRARAAQEIQAAFPDNAPVTAEEREAARGTVSPELQHQCDAIGDQADPRPARILAEQ